MKNRLNTRGTSRNLFKLVLLASLALPLPALAASVTLASSPLQNAAASTVMPNVMFMLDDSGSMDWDYMPDDSKNFSGQYGFNTNHCNGVYYNPAITYTAPVNSDGSSYTDSTFTSAWRTGYNTGAGTVNLNTGFTGGSGTGASGINLTPGPAFYYTYLTATTTPTGNGTQSANWQMDFHNSNSTFYKECISAVGSTTKVDGTNPVNTLFSITTLGSTETSLLTVNSSTAKATFTITVTYVSSTKVSNVKVGGTTITSGTFTSASTASAVAAQIAANISAAGYTATNVSGSNIVTVTGPVSVGSTVAVNNSSGTDTYSYSLITPISVVSGITVNGTQLMLSGSAAIDSSTSTTAANIALKINATGYTATSSSNVVTITCTCSVANYTPVITYSGTLTYTVTQFPDTNAAHLTNFANWYSYYSTRMLMMKTGVGQAFSPSSLNNYRIGFMTMNNNVSPDIVEIAPFNAAQRLAWYTKLYASTPGMSTPLREALSHVGQMYAHKFGDYDIYTATVTVGGSTATSEVVTSVSVMEGGIGIPVETMYGTTAGSTSTSTVAANINIQINLTDPSNYGSSVSGNVVTITGPVAALGAVPVILTGSGSMTFTATPFVKTTIHAQMNGITPADPVQYSCQQNFVILSTDGYWNGATDYDLSTPNMPVGNQDGLAPRPMYDGGLFTKTTSHTTQQQTQKNLTTSQIQKRTTQIQSSTSNLQSSSYNLQKTAYALQSSTSTLQSLKYALQNVPSYLQSQTSQLTKVTTILRGTLSKVLMTCNGTAAACGTAPATGVAGGGWTVVTSGTCTSAASVQCSIVSGLSGASNVATTCNTSASISTSGATFAKFTITVTGVGSATRYNSIKIDGVEILTGQTSNSSNSTNNQVAANIGAKVGNGYSASVSSNIVTITNNGILTNVSAITSSTISSGGPATLTGAVSGSSGATYTLNNADSNGKVYSACSYAAGSTTGVSSCTAVAQSGSSPYTVLTAVTCPTNVTSAWANTGATCTVNATPDVNGFTTACRYNTPSPTPSSVGSCTYQVRSSASPYTVLTENICSYAATSPTVTTVTSCAITQTSSTANGTVWDANGHTCGYTAYTAAAPAGSCTYKNQSGGSPFVGPAVTCSYAAGTVSTVTTCTVSAKTAGTTDSTVWNAAAVDCSYNATPVVTTVSSCTTVAQSASSPYAGPAVACAYTPWTAYANASSCTPVDQSIASPYTVGTAKQCQTTDTGFVGATSCANSGPTNGLTVYCPNPNPVVTGPTPVLSCTAGTSTCTSPFTAASCIATSCTTKTIQSSTLVPSCTQGNNGTPNFIQTSCTTSTLSTTTNVTSCTPGNGGPPSYIQTTCTSGAGGTSDTLADVAMYYYQTDIRDASLDNCNGAASTDFPSGNPDVCTDDVPETKLTQHMTTYTLGLGARGRMVYTSKDYMKDLSGDFYSVYDPKKLGIKADSTQTPPICSWQADGTICNWPIPASGSISNIDDLWHAAVDGNGTYYSAKDPAELSDGLSSALTSITAKKGAAAAAATSTLNPVAGNNFAYVASYTTLKWIGNLEARTIDTVTGVISKNANWCAENLPADTCAAPGMVVTSINVIGNSTTYNCVTPNSTAAACLFPNVFDSVANTCSAQMTLACTGTLPPMIGPVASPNTDPCYNNANCDKRTIITANSTGNLVNFYYGNLTAAQQAYFNAATISGLSQWTTLTAAQQTAAAGANLVNYLRGQKSYEDSTTNPASNRLFRSREAVLGDALESQPSFIAAPTFSYTDAGYSAFAAAQASRPGTVYMGTNDGMLHAFDGQNGNERWAFVPSVVIPNLWHLADTDYGTNHVNFVNGSPVISDYYCTTSCPSGAAEWRTILVGGLNAGGREYYALDITDPTAPTLLWEFTPTSDANLGYSFGLPVITKMADNTWVVLVTSGYDNGTLSGDGVTSNSPAGDGKGYLYALNARTGAIIKKIGDSTGSTTTPSGLSRFSVWNDATDNNLAGSTYGGDLLGNVWRFDINSSAFPGTNPVLFAILKDASGVTQPVTTSPILGEVKGHRVVFVGTGKYLENSDNTSTQTQTLYAIKDDSATATLVNPRSYTATSPKMVQQTISTNMVDPTTGITIRQGSFNPVSFDTDRGWFVDFPESGERVNIDGKLVLGTLLVPTIVPKSSFCSPGGHGWLNYFDYTNGWPTTNGTGVGPDGTNQNVSVHFDASIVGMNILFIGGKPVVEVVTSDNPTPEIPPIPPVFNGGNSNFTGKRMQWRELIP